MGRLRGVRKRNKEGSLGSSLKKETLPSTGLRVGDAIEDEQSMHRAGGWCAKFLANGKTWAQNTIQISWANMMRCLGSFI